MIYNAIKCDVGGVYKEAGWTSLTTLCIGEKVEFISEFAFKDCSNLTTLIYDNVANCNLRDLGLTSITSLHITEKVETIPEYAFYNCFNLREITSRAVVPPVVKDMNAFYNVSLHIPVYVPEGSLEDYRKANVWFQFFNLQAIEETTGLDNNPTIAQDIVVRGRDIIINRADQPLISLYDVSGRLIHQGYDQHITVAETGVYVVMIGQEAVKIVVR